MAKKKTVAKNVFVVVRRGWEESYGDDWSFTRFQAEEQAGRVLGRPVAVCADQAAAEARAEELEREAREALNPFLFVGPDEYQLAGVTSLSVKKFDARLKALLPGVRLPKADADDERDWFGWWAKHADGLGEGQRAAVWGLLDRLKFYGVLKAEVGQASA